MTSEQVKEEFIREIFNRDDAEEFALELEADKKLLDNEMKDVVFIPNRFHGYLHSSKGRCFPHAKDSQELYDQFLKYRDELKAEHYLKLIDNSGDSVFKKLDAISRITDFLLYNKRKDDVLDMLDGALEVAEEILSKMQ